MLKCLTLGNPHCAGNVFIDLIPHLATVSLSNYANGKEPYRSFNNSRTVAINLE